MRVCKKILFIKGHSLRSFAHEEQKERKESLLLLEAFDEKNFFTNSLKKALFAAFLSSLFCPALFAETLTLTLVYPLEGSKIPIVKNSFVFGSVVPSQATVTINGSTVSIYPTGSYLAMLPFNPGEFKITAQATLGSESAIVTRTVFVSSPALPLPFEPLKIATASMQPSGETTVVAGDILQLRFQGSPNCKAEYRFKNWKNFQLNNEWNPMTEKTVPIPGIYEASFIVGSEDKAEKALIEYRLTSPSGKNVKTTSSVAIKIKDANSFSLMEINVEEATIRTGPNMGSDQMAYDLFLPKGVRVRATGQIGNEARIKLSNHISGWTDQKNLKILPDKTFVPPNILDSIKIQNKKRGNILAFNLNEKTPYRATLSTDLKLFTLTFFNTISNLDRFRYDAEELTAADLKKERSDGRAQTAPLGQDKEDSLEQIRWFQTSQDTVEVQCQLKEKIWGYDLRYEGNKLICEILSPPRKKKDGLPLSGLTVAIDPGHSLEFGDGAIGPSGVKEGEINFKIASCLKEKLEKSGAAVTMTRAHEERIPLQERGKRAWQSKADLFVSVHTNALPEGANPFERRGFSVYYFQPQSFDFARAVHSSYRKMVQIPDDGFYYGNLAVCRVTQMPAILTESGYLILPEEEALLLKRDFQCLCSEAIVNGILKFLRS